VYAKYYFDLRALAEHHDLSFPSEPLSKDRAIKLEVSVVFNLSLTAVRMVRTIVAYICDKEQDVHLWFEPQESKYSCGVTRVSLSGICEIIHDTSIDYFGDQG